jgi:lipoprotein-anchoring transpeptidase ErfK/SrfK
MMFHFRLALAAAAACLAVAYAICAAANVTPAEEGEQPAAKRTTDLIRKQRAPLVATGLAAKVTTENSRLVINLATQRAYLMAGADVYIDSPISSGKRSGPTPTGTFSILEKIKEHRSGIYGNFVDRRGQVVRSGVSMKLDAAPAGTHYVDAPMHFFCRLTDGGIGIHGGLLPGYPASHGSIRIPEEIAKLVFEKVKVGTPVEIRAE